MKKIGIIDIGSNSMRLVLAEIKENTAFKIIDELKETVRLAEGLTITEELDLAHIENALQTLKMFKKLCDAQPTDKIITVATAAVRKATNSQILLCRAKEELNLDIQILSGEEEGYFDFWGIINSMALPDGLIIDLGGASTELIWFQNRKIIECLSLPIGAINLTQRFQLDKVNCPQTQEEREADLQKYLLNIYNQIPWLSKLGKIPLIGAGGTFRNIGKIDRNQKKYPLSIAHNYEMNSKDLFDIYTQVSITPLKKRKKIKGLSRDRADIFLSAITTIWLLIDFCQLERILISGNGLREGLIYKLLLTDQPVDDVLDFSIHNIITNYDLNQSHSMHIFKLTKSLYYQLIDIHQIKINLDRVLKTASMLHDAGINIRYYGHQEHSFYMILNAGINGLSQKELLMSALLASAHRKSRPGKKSEYKGILNKEELKDIYKIGILLRIAESFDRSLNRIIQDVQCEITEGIVRIKTIAKEKPELEIKDAMTAAEDFKKLFKKSLIIEQGDR